MLTAGAIAKIDREQDCDQPLLQVFAIKAVGANRFRCVRACARAKRRVVRLTLGVFRVLFRFRLASAASRLVGLLLLLPLSCDAQHATVRRLVYNGRCDYARARTHTHTHRACYVVLMRANTGMLSTSMNIKVENGEIKDYCVVRVVEFVCNVIQQKR